MRLEIIIHHISRYDIDWATLKNINDMQTQLILICQKECMPTLSEKNKAVFKAIYTADHFNFEKLAAIFTEIQNSHFQIGDTTHLSAVLEFDVLTTEQLRVAFKEQLSIIDPEDRVVKSLQSPKIQSDYEIGTNVNKNSAPTKRHYNANTLGSLVFSKLEEDFYTLDDQTRRTVASKSITATKSTLFAKNKCELIFQHHNPEAICYPEQPISGTEISPALSFEKVFSSAGKASLHGMIKGSERLLGDYINSQGHYPGYFNYYLRKLFYSGAFFTMRFTTYLAQETSNLSLNTVYAQLWQATIDTGNILYIDVGLDFVMCGLKQAEILAKSSKHPLLSKSLSALQYLVPLGLFGAGASQLGVQETLTAVVSGKTSELAVESVGAYLFSSNKK